MKYSLFFVFLTSNHAKPSTNKYQDFIINKKIPIDFHILSTFIFDFSIIQYKTKCSTNPINTYPCFITSRFDFCNSVLYGWPGNEI